MNDNSSKGFLWIIPVVVIVFGVLCVTGLMGLLPSGLATLMKIIGIAAIAIGVIILAIVIAVIIIAVKSSHEKEDTNLEDKAQVRKIITEKEKELSKLRSTISVTKMSLRRTEDRVKLIKGEPDFEEDYKELLSECADLQKIIDEAEHSASELHKEILQLKQRKNSAEAKFKKAEYIREDSEKVDTLEQKAQREEDMANALLELEGKRMQ